MSASEITVYRSEAERQETNADFVRDSARRRERGEAPRDPVREPARRHRGPWFAFRPFEGETSAGPYAVIRTLGAVPAEGAYGETLARVSTGSGTVDLAPADVVEAAAAGRFGLTVTGGPLADEASELAGAAEARLAGQAAARLAADGERRRAEAEAREAVAAVPSPAIGGAVWFWQHQASGSGYGGATERLCPLPATVLAVGGRDDGGPPPRVALVVFGLGGSAASTVGWTDFAAGPRADCWTWPVEGFTPLPWLPSAPRR